MAPHGDNPDLDAPVEACEDAEHAGPRTSGFSPAAFEKAASLFRAIGDPERLKLLELLMAGEACVSDLTASVRGGISTVSQRLRVLRAEGLVVRRRAGKHVYYALSDQHIIDLVRNALVHATERRSHETE